MKCRLCTQITSLNVGAGLTSTSTLTELPVAIRNRTPPAARPLSGGVPAIATCRVSVPRPGPVSVGVLLTVRSQDGRVTAGGLPVLKQSDHCTVVDAVPAER